MNPGRPITDDAQLARFYRANESGGLIRTRDFCYLFGPDGALLTFLPPILPPERMAEIIASYIH